MAQSALAAPWSCSVADIFGNATENGSERRWRGSRRRIFNHYQFNFGYKFGQKIYLDQRLLDMRGRISLPIGKILKAAEANIDIYIAYFMAQKSHAFS